MLKKRLLSALLCLCMLVGMLPTITPTASALTATSDASGPESIAQLRTRFPNGEYWNHVGADNYNNPHGYNPLHLPCNHHNSYCGFYPNQCECNSFDNAIQCMGFAYRLAYGYYRTSVRNWSSEDNNGLETLKAGDVVDFGWSGYGNNRVYGHTIWITSVQGDTITYADCNYGYTCLIRWIDSPSNKYNVITGNYTIHHAPYAATGGSAQPTAQNIGEDFYAYIHNTYSGHALENHSNNVQLAAADNYDPRQIWHFIHLGYNQYKIINMYDGRCLDTNGTSVQVLPFVGNANQLWQICGTDSHSNSTLYYLAPPGYGTNNTNHTSVLDVAYGNDDYVPTGRDVQLSKNWYGGSGSSFINDGPFHKAQTFQIIKISQDDIRLGSNRSCEYSDIL